MNAYLLSVDKERDIVGLEGCEHSGYIGHLDISNTEFDLKKKSFSWEKISTDNHKGSSLVMDSFLMYQKLPTPINEGSNRYMNTTIINVDSFNFDVDVYES